MPIDDIVNAREFEPLARAAMEPSLFDYYAGGAGDEATLADNIAAFGRVGLRPRMLAGVADVDLGLTLFGQKLSMPIGLAPTAFNRLGHPDGEMAAARAAAEAGVLMCVSTIASTPLEEVAAAASGPKWFQLYVYRDREVTRDLIARAEAAGYLAIVLTVDTPHLGRRERDVRNRFTLPDGVTIRNLERYGRDDRTRWNEAASFTAYVHRLLDPTLTWESVEWLRSTTSLPVIVKGLLTSEDARLAVDHGAHGVVVSNHGGRQLDGAVATLDALPEISDAIAGRIPIMLDGGVRRGVDVVKALALGASAALIGRPYLWALAAGGEAGVSKLLSLLRAELELAMGLCGCRTISDVTKALVRR